MPNKEQETNDILATEELDIKELFNRVIRKWYIFLISGAALLSIALLYILRTPSQYRTEGILLLRSESGGLGNSMSQIANIPIAADMFNIKKAVDDELVLLRSKTLIGNAVNELSLRTATYYRKRLGGAYELYNNEPLVIVCPDGFFDTFRGSLTVKAKKTKKGVWKFRFTRSIKSSKEKFSTRTDNLNRPVETPWGSFLFIENPENIDPDYPHYSLLYIIQSQKDAVERYSSLLTSEPTAKNANAMTIAIEGSNPAKNEAIVNKIIELYNREAMRDKHMASSATTGFISERLATLEKELQVIEGQVEAFRTQHNIADMGTQSRIALEAVSEYDIQITNIDMQYSLMTFVEEYIRKSDIYDLIPSNTGISDESLSNLIISYNNQVLEYLRLTRSTNEENPVVSQQKDKILLTRDIILQTITNIKDGIQIRRQDIMQRSRELQAQINTVPALEREYVEIGRMQKVKRELYVFLLQQYESAQLSMSTAVLDVKTVDNAYTAVSPVAPRRLIIMAAALFVALVVSAGYIFLRIILQGTVDSPDRLKSLANAAIAGVLPHLKKKDSFIVVNPEASSTATDMFRLLRSNITFEFAASPGCKVLLVTSSAAAEGRTFIAANLALSIAMLGRRVALVGLDFRNPDLSRRLSLRTAPGIADCLAADNCDMAAITQPYSSINVIPAGQTASSSVELLDSARLDGLFAALRQSYDYVIVDSAPICTGIPDTLQLSRFADMTLFVCRADRTKQSAIATLNGLIAASRLTNVRLVYNDRRPSLLD